jgi:hypothetical protein
LEYVYDFTTGNGESPEGLVTLVLCEAKWLWSKVNQQLDLLVDNLEI